jgi:hypothetical protein
MFDRILNEMRDKIRERKYVMTIHGEEEMNMIASQYTMLNVVYLLGK